MTTTIFPNGLVLNSSALTVAQMNNAIQAVTCFALGITTNKGQQVRVSWPTQGQPGFGIADNLVFLRCTEVDDWYNKTRDEDVANVDDASAQRTIEYTRIWRVFWEFRGPTSYTQATTLKTAMQLEFVRAMVSPSNLYLVANVANPQRSPELEDGQWWERTDLTMHFNEQVTETITLPTVASIEVIVETQKGIALEIEV